MNLKKVASFSLCMLTIVSLAAAQVAAALCIIPALPHYWGVAIFMVMLLGFSIAVNTVLKHFDQRM